MTPSATADAPLLELDDVTISYRRGRRWVEAVRSVSLRIAPGEAYGLVGESGCGKSTVAMAVLRYLPRNGRLDHGLVRFEGQDLFATPEAALRSLRGDRIAIVYQNPGSALNPSLRVGEQVAELFRFHRRLGRREALAAAVDMLAKVRIADPARVAAQYPYQLSGGMQQRVVIAMALATDPSLLVLDEPTTALDTTVQAEILDLFADLRQEFRASLLFISHNLGVVNQVCDRIGVMYAGEIVEQGDVAEVFRRPRHPYTAALFDCIPDFGVRKSERRLASIPGFLPTLGHPPSGCRFEPRCPISRTGTCDAQHPPLFDVAGNAGDAAGAEGSGGDAQGCGADHVSRCFFAAETPRPGTGLPAVAGAGGTAGTPFFQARQVGRRYGAVTIIRDIDLAVQPGETFGLVGESGSGKSTLAKVITGLDPPSHGEVLIDGRELAGRAGRRTRQDRRDIQMVFQSPDTTLNPRKRIAAVLERPVRVLGAVGRRGAREKARSLMADVQLPDDLAAATPLRLSGGQRQRVAIARAFAGDPRLVILDEPTSALDVSVQAAILNLLIDLQRDRQVAYLFISHDLAVVRYLSDRIGVMYLGELVETGPTERVFEPPHHPYTEALIAAVPRLGPDAAAGGVRLGGQNPGPAQRPTGCPFRTRCHRAFDRCVEDPPWREGRDGHRLRCWIPLDDLTRLQAAVPAVAEEPDVGQLPPRTRRGGA